MKIFKNNFFQFGLAFLGGVVLYIFFGQAIVGIGATFINNVRLETRGNLITLATPGTSTIGLLVQTGRTGINIGTSTVPQTRLHIKGNLRVDSSSDLNFPLSLTSSLFLGSTIKSFLPINLNGVSYYADLVRNTSSHSFADCINPPNLGTIATDNGVAFCNMPRSTSTCPSGWTQYQSWSQTQAKACGGSTVGVPSACLYLAGCLTPYHFFSSTSTIESCGYRTNIVLTGPPRGDYCTGDPQRCYASVIRMGCY